MTGDEFQTATAMTGPGEDEAFEPRAASIIDDGSGRAPAGWAHGLGLGGVRKRVKLLGGQVQWHERDPRGIRCEVTAPLAA